MSPWGIGTGPDRDVLFQQDTWAHHRLSLHNTGKKKKVTLRSFLYNQQHPPHHSFTISSHFSQLVKREKQARKSHAPQEATHQNFGSMAGLFIYHVLSLTPLVISFPHAHASRENPDRQTDRQNGGPNGPPNPRQPMSAKKGQDALDASHLCPAPCRRTSLVLELQPVPPGWLLQKLLHLLL